MSHIVRVEAAVPRALRRLPQAVVDRIWAGIRALSDDPRPWGSQALSGTLRPFRKLRIGDYRVAYRVDDDAQVVTVVWAGHRSRIYEELERRQ